MKKSFITFTVTFLPSICYANTSPQGGGMSSFVKIVIGVSLFFVFAVVWVIFDTRRESKKNEQRRRVGGNKPNKININDNIDLRKQNAKISEEKAKLEEKNAKLEEKNAKLEEELKMLTNKLSEMDNEIAFLSNKIMEMNSSSSRSNMHSNDSNKQDENINKTDVDDNNKTNSSPLVGKLNYIELAVINGSLVKAESEQTYYRAWRENGQIMFEFVNNDRTRKAINNRTIIVEPFCIKLESSKSPDVSEEIETKTPGILNDDFTLRKKAEIIYK